VRAITQGRALSVFASTKIQSSAGWRGVGLRQKLGSLVRTVTKGLAGAFTARAPKIFFSFDDLDRVRAFLCDNWIRHTKFLCELAVIDC
jgi:hypothetical protein